MSISWSFLLIGDSKNQGMAVSYWFELRGTSFKDALKMYFALMIMINTYLAKATIMAIPVMDFQVRGKNNCTFCNFV